MLAVMEFRFMGGSMGSVVGEKITRAVERGARAPAAADRGLGLGRRAHAGGRALAHADGEDLGRPRPPARRRALPYISVLTDPTTGGVTASFAMLGDINIAEPGRLIGFAGPRVIEQTIRQSLPEGFQRSEFLLEQGFLDLVVAARASSRRRSRRCLRHLQQPAPLRRPATRMRSPAAILSRLEAFGIRLGLESMATCSRALGDPQRRFPVVLVAGTNGKGSTSALLAVDPPRRRATASASTPRRTSSASSERIRVDGRVIEPRAGAASSSGGRVGARRSGHAARPTSRRSPSPPSWLRGEGASTSR